MKMMADLLPCAGKDRAEEEVTQLEDRGWDRMLCTVTSCSRRSSWNLLHRHGAGAQQVLRHNNEGNARWFTHSREFAYFETASSEDSNAARCFSAALSVSGKYRQRRAARGSASPWTIICRNAGFIPHPPPRPSSVTPKCCEYRLRLKTFLHSLYLKKICGLLWMCKIVNPSVNRSLLFKHDTS